MAPASISFVILLVLPVVSGVSHSSGRQRVSPPSISSIETVKDESTSMHFSVASLQSPQSVPPAGHKEKPSGSKFETASTSYRITIGSSTDILSLENSRSLKKTASLSIYTSSNTTIDSTDRQKTTSLGPFSYISTISRVETERTIAPLITHSSLTESFIQSEAVSSIPSLVCPASRNRTCNNPSRRSQNVCNPRFLTIVYLILFAFITRILFLLQELSAKHILEMGERMARRQESGQSWSAWVGGSLRVPNLKISGFQKAMDKWILRRMEAIYGREVLEQAVETDQERRSGPVDYRRRNTIPGTNTPLSATSQKTEEYPETGTSNNALINGTSRQQPQEVRHQAELDEEDDMVRRIHERLLNDSKHKRIWYGATISLLTVGSVFLVLGVLMGITCGEISRLSKNCQLEG